MPAVLARVKQAYTASQEAARLRAESHNVEAADPDQRSAVDKAEEAALNS